MIKQSRSEIGATYIATLIKASIDFEVLGEIIEDLLFNHPMKDLIENHEIVFDIYLERCPDNELLKILESEENHEQVGINSENEAI